MAQVTSGLRRILSSAPIYNSLQYLVGARKSKDRLVREFIKVEAGHRLLDIGCGTALVLDHLPGSVEYVGIDASREYIDHAREKHGNRGRFICQQTADIDPGQYKNFDRVLAIGLLHHLNDQEVVDLMNFAKSSLKSESGEFHSIDPCYANGQSRISKFLIDRDRGQNVRTRDEYQSLARQVFSDVTLNHKNDMLRIPYDHAILRCH